MLVVVAELCPGVVTLQVVVAQDVLCQLVGHLLQPDFLAGLEGGLEVLGVLSSGKVIADADGKLLGCHLYGPHAADLVQEVCALISTGATVEQLKRIIHTHPTLGEVVQTAAHTM